MTREEIENLLRVVKEKIESQGRVVDDRLLQKQKELEKLLNKDSSFSLSVLAESQEPRIGMTATENARGERRQAASAFEVGYNLDGKAVF